MMRLVYNIGLLLGLILALPWSLVKALWVPGSAAWAFRRLAWSVKTLESAPISVPTATPTSTPISPPPSTAVFAPNSTPSAALTSPRIWLHALSVGETASVLPLLRALRKRYPQATLLLSNSTRAGSLLAAQSCADLVDARLIMPYDLPGAAARIIRSWRPDLFILVETDFWPNLLGALARAKVPTLLVNGRMSKSSWGLYRMLRFWAKSLFFAPFSFLAMQSKAEADRILALGLAQAKVGAIGNLKYPAAELLTARHPRLGRLELGIGAKKLLWVAGSLHDGEEEIILRAFRRLLVDWPELFLVLAPRRVERAAELLELARKYGCRVRLRADLVSSRADLVSSRADLVSSRADLRETTEVLIVNSYGELTDLYALGEMVFIGGSLVKAGGHNPLEAAAWGKPVLFGPHMDDFAEISADLLALGGALQVQDEDQLVAGLRRWLLDPEQGAACGRRGRELVRIRSQGVLGAHLTLIAQLLNGACDAKEEAA